MRPQLALLLVPPYTPQSTGIAILIARTGALPCGVPTLLVVITCNVFGGVWEAADTNAGFDTSSTEILAILLNAKTYDGYSIKFQVLTQRPRVAERRDTTIQSDLSLRLMPP